MRSARFALRNFSAAFVLVALTLAQGLARGQSASSNTVAANPSLSPINDVSGTAKTDANGDALRTKSADRYDKSPLAFEANTGQADSAVRFLARGHGYGLYLTDREAVLALRGNDCASASSRIHPRTSAKCAADTTVVRMALDAANDTASAPAGEDRQTGVANYFIGKNSSQWRSSVPLFGKVRYSGVYPGVDLVYYGSQQQLEYDFVVAPQADPSLIHLRFDGAKPAHIAPDGSLQIAAQGDRAITLRKPVSYQFINGERQPVESHFVLLTSHAIGFELGAYDHTQPLVIDPVLIYSTYLTGTGRLIAGQTPINDVLAIAADPLGDTYVTGYTFAANFPVSAGAFQSQEKGTANVAPNAFVTEFDPNGGLVFSTYLGGSGQFAYEGVAYEGDQANAIVVDTTGIYIAGYTYSTDFPITSTAFQKTLHPSATLAGCPSSPAQVNSNGFVTKLSPSGASLLYSTYLGGSGRVSLVKLSTGTSCLDDADDIQAMAVDVAGDVFVAGYTASADFPVTSGAYQTTNHNTQVYASGNLADGNLLDNGFVTKLNPAGSALLYSTYLGGTNSDYIQALKIDAAGDAFVVGSANSSNFPITAGAYQSALNSSSASGTRTTFATKLNAAGSGLLYSTFLGSVGDSFNAGTLALAVDGTGDAFVGGGTTSVSVPITSGAFQPTNKALANGGDTGVLLKLSPDGTSLLYATYLGGSGIDSINALALDATGDIYIAGTTSSTDYPTTANALQPSNNSSACNSQSPANNAVLTELNPQGTALVYSTYLGGSGSDDFYGGVGDSINGMTLDIAGNVYVGGHSYSSNFPVTYNAFQTTPNLPYQSGGVIGSGFSGFVAKLNLSGTTITPTVKVSPATFSGGASAQNVTATVSTAIAGKPVPTGTLLLEISSYLGSVYQASATLNNGQAQFTIPANALASASYCLIGSYMPDQNSSTVYNPGAGVGTAAPTAGTVATTVATQPAGLSITVDGTSYTAPQTFNWNQGDTHTIATTEVQTNNGTQNTFNSWSDAGAISHSITVGAASTTYTATFSTTFELTTASSPTAGGTVYPPSGGFYAPGTTLQVTATANPGYAFSGWTGPVASASNSTTTVTLSGPVSVTANFTATTALAYTYLVTTLTDDGGNSANCVANATDNSGGNGACSLRDALLAANALPANATATINFWPPLTSSATAAKPAVYLLGYSSATPTGGTGGALSVTGHANIIVNGPTTGSGNSLANLLAIDASGVGTGFNIDTGTGNTTLNNLILQNAAEGTNLGVASGTVRVNGCTLTGGYNFYVTGPGIEMTGGTAIVTGSTISNNGTHNNGPGGGIGVLSGASLTLIDSTVSGNTVLAISSGSGGGIFMDQGSTVTLINTTVSGNSVTNGGAPGAGGGIYVYTGGILNLYNSIVEGNSGNSPDLSGPVAVNISSLANTTANASTPQLSALGNYGGPTQTMVPLPGSPAICAGASSINGITVPATDQRGATHSSAYCTAAQLDAGAVQTSYTLGFTTQPPASVAQNATMSPVVVQLVEDGLPSAGGTPSITLTDADSALASAPVAQASPATYSSLVFNKAETSDSLTATAQLGVVAGASATLTATSSTFSISSTATPSPTVTGVSPNSGPVTGGTPVTITGTNFASGAQVSFGGIPATGVTFVNTTTLTATSPAGTGTVDVLVTIPGVGASATSAGDRFTYTATQPTTATVTISNTNQTYTGSPLPVTVMTNPTGLTVAVTYNGSATPPTAAGSYSVVATVTSSGYTGSNTGTLIIAKATATVLLGNLTQTYTGSPLSVTATTTPTGLSTSITYNGSSTSPTAIGTYSVAATITDANYTGSATGTFNITAVVVPTFTLSASSAQTAASGSSAQFTITATATNGAFANPVSLSVSGLPPGATAAFNPASITPGATSATSTLTITLPQSVATMHSSARSWSIAFLGLPFCGLLLLRRSRSRLTSLALLLLACFASLGILTGCGQNGFNYNTTSSQAYTITITGTSGAVTATTTAQLTVTSTGK